jgi:SAM-dependent methyltransferase
MRAAVYVYFLAAARVVSSLVPLSNTQQSRSRFLSSSAAAFFASGLVLASDSESCSAKTMAEGSNPRYIDRELEMKYAEDKNGNPRTRGMLVRRFTGDSTPYSFPVTPIRLVKEWPDEPPFKPEDFFRADEIDDGSFYAVPRLVYHIDEPAVASLTQYYRNNIPAGSNILDICSSWISHYPLEFPDTMKRISATGMNKLELMYNDQLTDYQAKNLNVDPTLPYDDNTFNVVTCVVSIDYLISPIQVLKEVNRVLKPGGKVIISQSNRCFPSKAIAMWLQMNDRQHLELINGYLKYAGGFKDVKVFDITATDPGNKYNDPMFIVQAEKA